MRSRVLPFLFALLVLCVWPGNALQEFHGPGPMPVSGGWPPGLAEVVNSDTRFAGLTGFADVWAYYAGDTKALNAFLAQYARLSDTRLLVVLHTGRSSVNMKRFGGADEAKDADWVLLISEYYKGRENASAFEGRKALTTLDVYLGGHVNLKVLDVPAIVDLRSGGEIEAFVKKHQEMR